MVENNAVRVLASKKKAFLEAYVKSGNITSSAAAIDYHRNCHYDWLQKDEDYKQAFESAQFQVGDNLEAEAIKRANTGSDVLLIFLLKGFKPDKYKDRVSSQVEHKGANTGDPGRSRLSDKDLDGLIKLAQDMRHKRKAGPTPVSPIPGKQSSGNLELVQ